MRNQAPEILEVLAEEGFQTRGGFVARSEVLFGHKVVNTIHVEAPLSLIGVALEGYPLKKRGNAFLYHILGLDHGPDGDSFVDYTLEIRALAPSRSVYESVADF